MPVTRVLVDIDRCVIDGLAHEITLNLETVLIQGYSADGGKPTQVMREVLLTCPTTGRQFKATVPLPQSTREIITGAREATTEAKAPGRAEK